VPLAVADGFDKVFVGHHHVYESIANCVVPGSTEVQNMRDQSEKCVVVYDSESRDLKRLALPRTHPVILLRYDASDCAPQELLATIARDLGEPHGGRGAFVYVEISGTIKAGQSLSRAEILSLLRERDLFDYFVDLRYSTETKTAAQASQRGSSIDNVLRASFKGRDFWKARRYLAYSDDEELFTVIREEILSGHYEPKT
jgi:hypothetical protein